MVAWPASSLGSQLGRDPQKKKTPGSSPIFRSGEECPGTVRELYNNLHRAIAEKYRTDEWYDAAPALLTPREQEAVTQAKDELRKQGKPQEPNRLVAELTLGFLDKPAVT